MPAFGKAALIAGDMMLLYTSSVKVQVETGYLNLALMFVCSAVQASLEKGVPKLNTPPF